MRSYEKRNAYLEVRAAVARLFERKASDGDAAAAEGATAAEATGPPAAAPPGVSCCACWKGFPALLREG